MEDGGSRPPRDTDGPSGTPAELLPQVYEELRRLARSHIARERAGLTLQPTALVHEAYLRLSKDGADRRWDRRGHFFAAAAEAMRRILVDRARTKASLKRGKNQGTVPLDEFEVCAADRDERVLMIDEVMHHFEKEDPDHAEIVNLKFFGGLTNQQIAELRGVTERTIRRQWVYAKSCLYELLQNEHRKVD